MIRYALNCPKGHAFESWFPSSEAFAAQHSAALIACPVCGETKVVKALMAPSVRQGTASVQSADLTAPQATAQTRPLTQPANAVEAALVAMRRHVEQNSDYVGLDFVTEARRMHDGATPERAIYGEAKPDEARKLIEEGVPVAPLPFMPVRKLN